MASLLLFTVTMIFTSNWLQNVSSTFNSLHHSLMYFIRPRSYIEKRLTECDNFQFGFLTNACRIWVKIALDMEQQLGDFFGFFCITFAATLLILVVFMTCYTRCRIFAPIEKKIESTTKKLDILLELTSERRMAHQQRIKLLKIYRNQQCVSHRMELPEIPDTLTTIEVEKMFQDIDMAVENRYMGDHLGVISSPSTTSRIPKKKGSIMPRSNKASDVRMNAIRKRPSTTTRPSTQTIFRGTSV